MAGQKILPLRVAGFLDPSRQNIRETLGSTCRRAGAAAFADDTNHGMAVANIIREHAEQRVAIWVLLKSLCTTTVWPRARRSLRILSRALPNSLVTAETKILSDSRAMSRIQAQPLQYRNYSR